MLGKKILTSLSCGGGRGKKKPCRYNKSVNGGRADQHARETVRTEYQRQDPPTGKLEDHTPAWTIDHADKTMEDARIPAESIDNQEIETLLEKFDSRKSDEYLVNAYNEGKMIGTMTRL